MIKICRDHGFVVLAVLVNDLGVFLISKHNKSNLARFMYHLVNEKQSTQVINGYKLAEPMFSIFSQMMLRENLNVVQIANGGKSYEIIVKNV